MPLSSLMSRFNEPETLKMAKLGRELRAQGIDITDLSLGEPDFDTPEHIKKAAKRAIDENFSHYTPVSGYLDLREAVCTKLQRDNGLSYSPDQIVVSTGAKQCIANLVLATVDVGDEVIIPTPYWVTYSEIVRLAGGKVKFIDTDFESGWKVTPEQLERAITSKTKLFMFSSPCNPTGAIYSYEELTALVDVFKKHPKVLIMSDEIYEHINYVGSHHSIGTFESVKNRVVVINGLSKGFAMTGWRLGYLAASKEIAKACDKLQGQFTSATCSITQRAAIEALLGDLKPSMEMVKIFKQRRDLIMKRVADIPGMKCHTPPGAFYVFPNVEAWFNKKSSSGKFISNSDDLSMYLLHEAHVSTVSGKAFGQPNCIRLSFATSNEKIETAMRKIKQALDGLSH